MNRRSAVNIIMNLTYRYAEQTNEFFVLVLTAIYVIFSRLPISCYYRWLYGPFIGSRPSTTTIVYLIRSDPTDLLPTEIDLLVLFKLLGEMVIVKYLVFPRANAATRRTIFSLTLRLQGRPRFRWITPFGPC